MLQLEKFSKASVQFPKWPFLLFTSYLTFFLAFLNQPLKKNHKAAASPPAAGGEGQQPPGASGLVYAGCQGAAKGFLGGDFFFLGGGALLVW